MTYNLLDEPWLPVRWLGPEPPSSVGLREALIRAHEIAELATDNPLETLSLNRLLAALTASVFPQMADEAHWASLWEKGCFDPQACEAYLETYADRFDLLSADRPFFGHPQTEAREISPVSRLLHAAASGNNAVLFSHDMDSLPQPLTLAEAARAVVCTQGFALSGGPQAKPFPLSSGPLVGGAFFWLRGLVGETASLFSALLLNLSPSQEVWGIHPKDQAAWESATPPAPQKRDVGGLRELFTFQSRRLQLVLDSEQKVTGVRYNQGSKVEKLLYHDPYLAYKSGKEGEYPLRFSTGRALWQESAVYMMKQGGAGHAPRTIEWLSGRTLRRYQLERQTAFAVDVFGLVNDPQQVAKVELIRHERVIIYPNIIFDGERWETLAHLLKSTDEQAKRLQEATRAFASRSRLNKPVDADFKKVEKADLVSFVQMLDTATPYWLAVGSEFDSFLARIATLPIETDDLSVLIQEWKITIRQASGKALSIALEPFAQDARTWQALAEAETVLIYGTLYPKTKKTANV